MKNKISVVREALNTASTYRVRNRQHSMSITTSNNTHNVTSGVEREIHFLRPLQKANGAPTQTSNRLQAPPEAAAAAAAAPWRLTTETVYERQSDFSGRGENVTTLYVVWGKTDWPILGSVAGGYLVAGESYYCPASSRNI